MHYIVAVATLTQSNALLTFRGATHDSQSRLCAHCMITPFKDVYLRQSTPNDS